MIPVYNIILNDWQTGIDRISLVEMPAVESNFLAFNESKKPLYFFNEEQQMITGVLLRCDYPIYRCDYQLGEYYIQFNAKVIRELAEKLLKDSHQNWVNIEHVENSDVADVNMIQLFIKDTTKGINPAGFEDISDGSLFATFKVRNPKVWEAIKNGTFKGFSVEGLFDIEKNDEENEINEIMEMIDKIINKTQNKK